MRLNQVGARAREKMGKDITIYRSECTVAILSTRHSECCFGKPVLVIDGKAYKPSDILPSGLSADEMVQLFLMGGNSEKGAWSHQDTTK